MAHADLGRRCRSGQFAFSRVIGRAIFGTPGVTPGNNGIFLFRAGVYICRAAWP